MNTRENIQNIIRDLVSKKFAAYHDYYPIENGKPIDSIYFDEAQIEIISDGISEKDVQGGLVA